MDHFKSMYIDNELSLDEKILFVEQCYGNKNYTEDTVSLLKQEKQLSSALNTSSPEMELPASARGKRLVSMHSMGWAIAADDNISAGDDP